MRRVHAFLSSKYRSLTLMAKCTGDCPNAAVPKKCYSCGDSGHIVRFPYLLRALSGGEMANLYSPRADHDPLPIDSRNQSRECPQNPSGGASAGGFSSGGFASGGGAGAGVCYGCGQPGHISRMCPQRQQGGGCAFFRFTLFFRTPGGFHLSATS